MLTPRRRENLERLLNPKSVCYIGGSFLEQTIKANRNAGYEGDIWIVNPKLDTIAGLPCHRSIEALPGSPDAVFMGVNRMVTNATLPALDAAGVGGVICYAAGYSEIGGDGPALEEALKACAGDLALVGPNCYGIENYLHGVKLLAMSGGGHRVDRGCAFIGQSGSLCEAVTRNTRSAPLAYVISCGNQTVLDMADYIDVLIDKPEITCFALFIEGLRDVSRFSEVALRALKAGKPIIAVKSGTSPLGATMAMSHTASLAGNDEHYQALFDRLGIIRVETPVELLETAKLITYTGIPKGRRIVSFTCSGGDNEMIADLAATHGLELPQPTTAQRESMKEHMQLYTSISNPLDFNTTNWARYDVLLPLFTKALEGDVDLGFAVFEGRQDAAVPIGARETIEAARDAGLAAGVPMAHACHLTENSNQEDRDLLQASGMAMLQGLRDAVSAIGKTCTFGERRAAILARHTHKDLLIAEASPLSGTVVTMDEWQGKQALKAYGLPVPDGRVVDTSSIRAAAEEIGFPIVLKVLSDTILHKTDVGGVALDLSNAEEVGSAARVMADRLNIDRFLIEPMAPKPVAELIIGVTRSDVFGPVLVIGAGGILVELYQDTTCLLLPVHEDDVRAAIPGLKIAKLLDGFRGGPKGDIDALVEAIMAVARYAQENRDTLTELDINPLFVLPEGQGVVAVDALIRKA